MGLYINPLTDDPHGKLLMIRELTGGPVPVSEFLGLEPGHDGFFGVAVVDNGPFNAAGVAFDEKEVEDMVNPRDPRPIEYHIMHVNQIRELDPTVADCLIEEMERNRR